MSGTPSDDILAACERYLDAQQALIRRLGAGADPHRVATAMQAQLDQLLSAVQDNRDVLSRPDEANV